MQRRVSANKGGSRRTEPTPFPIWVTAVAISICTALLLLLQFYKPHAGSLWLDTFFNSMHVPTFWMVAICINVALGLNQNLGFGPRLAVTTGIAMLLGVVSEIVQIPGPRDASIDDLFANWLGSASAILLICALSRKRISSIFWRYYLYASIGLLVFALTPLLLVSAAYAERNHYFPVIIDFESRFSDYFFRLQDATLVLRDSSENSTQSGTITFGDGPWPGIIFHDIWPDWSDYNSLVVELDSNEAQSIVINVRVHDALHLDGDQPFSDRFNRRYTLTQGPHVVRIPLKDIRIAPHNREMDLSSIDGVAIFATRREFGRSFELLNMHLEK